ncbi:MAG: helicase-exonuclease AddAB subunit AddA [Oscillospiraceae bacterium]|nr:helicase-exonuclease AddAB subunit AddA [Oscillospiraceae bacterium]
MSEYKPTAAQKDAIECRGGTVLVSAGAGSGKTRVLTERLLRYIRDEEQPADLDSFLIITFTRAAAGELRGRITEELNEALAADPGNRRLRRQSALVRRAQIGTIHGFCAALLREHAHRMKLSPDFRIAAEERAADMKAAALERTLERWYDRQDEKPGFALLADTVGAGRDDRRLAELALSLYDRMQCHPRPERWAGEQVSLLREKVSDVGETLWGRELLRRAAEQVEYWCMEFERMLPTVCQDEKIRKAYYDSFAGTAGALRELRRGLSLGWEPARACFPIPFPTLGKLLKYDDPDAAEYVRERRKACKAAMDRLADSFADPSDKLLADMAATEPAMSALLQLVLDFEAEYAKDKRRANLLDYSDLEHMAAALLTNEDGSPTELAREISARYTEIMVDEYQDVSRVQDAIFRAVSREGRNLFLVGDVKQSIYRFRLADPTIFTEKYESYADAPAPGEPRRILLRENFRSRREILDAANAVFSLCMSRSLGDLDYDEAAALRYGADYTGAAPLPELTLLHLGAGGDDEESPDKTAAEAAAVAGHIRALVESGATVTERGTQRPMRYRDVAILLRSVNRVGGVYRRELVRQGVPVGSGQGGGFFSSVEVSALVNMLALVDNPHQDIPLIAVLRSPAFGFNADELSRIRARDKDCDLFGALRLDARENEKSRAFLALLERLRQEAPDLRAVELTWRLIEEMDLIAVCAAMSDGSLRRARIMAMVTLSERFEASGYRGLHRYVLWLRRMMEKNQEPALGSDGADAVQILSVHASKGLEFPVVFLCDTARQFNRRDTSAPVLVHPELGLGPKRTNLERRVEYPTLARHAIKQRLDRETLSEELRLLYVAMTRAKERLYLYAALKDPEKSIASARLTLSVPMAVEVLARAKSPADWLISAALADGGAHLRLRTVEATSKEAEEPAAQAQPELDAEAEAALRHSLAFRYPHRAAEDLPSKITATELKGRDEEDEEAAALMPRRRRPFRMPDFTREEKPLTGAERGTATHLVLQYMDFAMGDSLEHVKEEIERLRAARFLSDREAEAVDAEAVRKLFASKLGQRMLAADAIRREFKFSLLINAGELLGEASGEELLLQGVVDCFFEADGQLTIVDYKTDRLKNRAEAERRAAFYAGQLRAYARALTRICRKPVRECALFFLSVGETVIVPLSES